MPPAPAAVYFSTDGYSTRGQKLMGRQSAGAGFLRAYTQGPEPERHQVLLTQPAHAAAARASFVEAGHAGAIDCIGMADLERVGEAGCLYLPTPSLTDMAWRRARVGERRFSLCGVIHTIATHAAMTAAAELLTAPVRPWDALVCTSRAGRDAIARVLEAQAEYLRWRLGATRLELPQLPVIPLGVHCDDFAFGPAQRHAARARLGAAEDELVVLFAGRLSFHAKAHPHPMLLALQRCVQARPGPRVHLVQCGAFSNEAIRAAFGQVQAALAPDVVHHTLDGRDAQAWQDAWAAADVFTSLSDNVQETFGLTPLEAMAAGLPVVVSDWSGYRDTVRDGVDGFCIPTTLPPPGDGADLAARYDTGQDSYDLYCGQVCELTAVDVDAAVVAFARLRAEAGLRHRMGASGRARARARFDWAVVMAEYRALWARLADERRHAVDLVGAGPLPCQAAPDRMDPFRMFEGFATRTLADTDRLELLQALDRGAYDRIRDLACHRFAGHVLPTHAQAAPLWRVWSRSPVATVAELTAGLPPAARQRLRRGLVWLLKTGLARQA
jgi:alpha-maltose-1-phosphate synthase